MPLVTQPDGDSATGDSTPNGRTTPPSSGAGPGATSTGRTGSDRTGSDLTGSGSPGDDAALTSPTFRDLVRAFREDQRRQYCQVRRRFEERVGGRITDEYISDRSDAGVAVVDKCSMPWWWRHTYNIYMTYDSSSAPAAVDDVVRRARSEERKWALVLRGTSQEIIAQAIFAVLVSMLNFADATGQAHGSIFGGSRGEDVLRSVRDELHGIRSQARRFARRSTLQCYLLGMFPGVLVSAGVARLLALHHVTIGAIPVSSSLFFCVVGGSLGAIISVMVRITRQENLEVDAEQGRTLSVCVGAFRPLIGGTLAAALYILIVGGLVPIGVPAGRDAAVFFAGISFLAGFSERWAQDTIVSSMPKGAGGPGRAGPHAGGGPASGGGGDEPAGGDSAREFGRFDAGRHGSSEPGAPERSPRP